jgi:hypothetical protein
MVTEIDFDCYLGHSGRPMDTKKLIQIARAWEIGLDTIVLLFLKICLDGVMKYWKSWKSCNKEKKGCH